MEARSFRNRHSIPATCSAEAARGVDLRVYCDTTRQTQALCALLNETREPADMQVCGGGSIPFDTAAACKTMGALARAGAPISRFVDQLKAHVSDRKSIAFSVSSVASCSGHPRSAGRVSILGDT